MKTLKNKWFIRAWALCFLALGFCTMVPPAQAQRVKASFSENQPLGDHLIFLLEEQQADGTWEVRYSAPGSPMIWNETPGLHTYRVRARDVVNGLESGPSNSASIELFAPPVVPGLESLLQIETTTEPVNVDPPPTV